MANDIDTIVRHFYGDALVTDSASFPEMARRTSVLEIPTTESSKPNVSRWSRTIRRRGFSTIAVSFAAVALMSGVALATDNPISSAINRTAASAMSAFRDPSPARKPLSPDVAIKNTEQHSVASAANFDDKSPLLVSDGQLLTTTSTGDTTLSIYATPTKSGQVCVTNVTHAGATDPTTTSGCYETLTDKQPFGLAGNIADDHLTLGGAVADDITKVEILTKAGWQNAPIQNNGFAWISPSRSDTPTSLRATTTTGAVITQPYDVLDPALQG